jgi:hypothetical protein
VFLHLAAAGVLGMTVTTDTTLSPHPGSRHSWRRWSAEAYVPADACPSLLMLSLTMRLAMLYQQ